MKRALEPVLIWGTLGFATICASLLAAKTFFPDTSSVLGRVLFFLQLALDLFAVKICFRLSTNRAEKVNAFELAAIAFLMAVFSEAIAGIATYALHWQKAPGSGLELAVSIPYLLFVALLSTALARLTFANVAKGLRYGSLLLGAGASAFAFSSFDHVLIAKLPAQTLIIHSTYFLILGFWFGFSLLGVFTGREFAVRLFSVGSLCLLTSGFYFQIAEILNHSFFVSLFEGVRMAGQLLVLHGLSQVEEINWVHPAPPARRLVKLEFQDKKN